MILIVDDDNAIRLSLSMLLRKAGYDVKAVPGPSEAMETVRDEAPQLVLLDMNFTRTTTGDEGADTVASDKDIPSRSAGDTHDRMGKHTACRGGDKGGCARLHH